VEVYGRSLRSERMDGRLKTNTSIVRPRIPGLVAGVEDRFVTGTAEWG
jgi:hypothetical protein